jgi:hypothetical protein
MQFGIGNPEEAGLSPPGSPAVLDDKVLPRIIIAHKQNRVIAGQASAQIMINATIIREKIRIDSHRGGQGSIIIEGGFEGGFIGRNILISGNLVGVGTPVGASAGTGAIGGGIGVTILHRKAGILKKVINEGPSATAPFPCAGNQYLLG